MDHMRSYWMVKSGAKRLTREEANLLMLERAVERLKGEEEPFVPGEVVFGMPAMDRWIDQMLKPAFQQDSPGDSAGNARLCAVYS